MNLNKDIKAPRCGAFFNYKKTGQPLRSDLFFGWGGGISDSLRSLDCFRQSKFLRLCLEILGRQVRTRWVLILTEN